jgi:hypothetical protein
MKLAEKVLTGATIASVAWALILAARLPIGLCLSIAGPLRDEFLKAHSEEEGRRLTAELCMTIGDTVRDVVLLSSAPALVTGVLWSLLAVVRWYRSVVPPRPLTDRPLKDGRRRPRP